MLKAKEITVEQGNELILKVSGKTFIKGKKLQLNTVNGYNIILTETEAKKYKIGDTIIFDLKDNKIKTHLSIEKGTQSLIFTGKHSGKYGEILSTENNIVKIKTDVETFETNKDYALIINKEKKAELD